MIDVEVDVFDRVYPSVSPLVPYGGFVSQYVPVPPVFPFATLYEIDNRTDAAHRSTAVSEEYAVIAYEANVYAEDKQTCRNVMNALDTEMTKLGFTRNSMGFIPNLADSSLFRYTARYSAVAGENKTIYRHA